MKYLSVAAVMTAAAPSAAPVKVVVVVMMMPDCGSHGDESNFKVLSTLSLVALTLGKKALFFVSSVRHKTFFLGCFCLFPSSPPKDKWPISLSTTATQKNCLSSPLSVVIFFPFLFWVHRDDGFAAPFRSRSSKKGMHSGGGKIWS